MNTAEPHRSLRRTPKIAAHQGTTPNHLPDHTAPPAAHDSHTPRPHYSNGNAALFEGDLCLRVQLQGPVQLGIIPITRIGQEIARISSPVDPLAVLKRVGQALHREATALDIRRVLAIDHRGTRLSDPIEV